MLSYIIKNKLFNNTLIYSISTAIKRSIPFLILPILTRYLTPSEYGIIATFQVLLAVMIVLVSLNVDSAVAVNFFKIKKEDLKTYIGNAIFIFISSFISFFTIIFILKGLISNSTKFPENWLPIIILTALCHTIISLTITLWQVEQKPIPYGAFQILQTILNVGISVLLIAVFGWKWQGRLLGIIIAYIVFGFISCVVLFKRKYVKFSFNQKYTKDALIFGAGLIPATLGWWIISGTNRFFITSMVNVSATGIYTVGAQIGMLIGLLVDSFSKAWSPFLFEKLKKDEYETKRKIVKFTYLCFAGITICTIVFIFIAPYFLAFFVGKNFHSANKYILWIALGHAFNGMRYFIVDYIYYVKKTYISGGITFLTAIMNAFLNYYFISEYGAIGAAYSTAITYFVNFVLTWILSAKVYKMPWFEKSVINFK